MTTSIKFRALTDEDHKLFFEALGEYGKDFQNIQQYMAQKGSQKSGNNNSASYHGSSSNNYLNGSNASGNSGTSNSNNRSSEPNKTIDLQEKRELDKKEDDRKRDQIRNFYNKLYAKLSELIGKIDDRVDKVTQELYLLINYGEIWKRHGFNKFNSKTKKLLEELVYQGTTTFRFEKKNVRLRTPACKALKKINKIGIDEDVKVVTTRELPKDVIVELHPASNRDWLRVQSMSQNPRVRARLSIQKRLTSILDYLENKWDLSPDKLNRTVDAWLKVSNNIHQSGECGGTNTNNGAGGASTGAGAGTGACGLLANAYQTSLSVSNLNNPSGEFSEATHNPPTPFGRLRLKPSDHHELKEVNITRVVPDNHLDLSLNAYIKRLEVTQPRCEQSSKELAKLDAHHTDAQVYPSQQPQLQQQHPLSSHEPRTASSENPESSCSVVANRSQLPVSLTTPDCSILLERSCTSEQPSIAQARKHLSILQSLTGTLEGCENSRTAYEDTQDRSLMNMLLINQNSRSVSFAPNLVDHEPVRASQSNPTILINKDIPALYDEDAALPVSSPNIASKVATDTSLFGINNQATNNSNSGNSNSSSRSSSNGHCNPVPANPLNADGQNSKSVDFQIPKNVTLGDFFKMSEPTPSASDVVMGGPAGDEAANDAFLIGADDKNCEEDCDLKDVDRESEDHFGGLHTKDPNGPTSGQSRLQNHVIEIQKFAEGWTRQDEPSITLGELYLAFKCPDKIILEYEFEPIEASQRQFDSPHSHGAISAPMHQSANASATAVSDDTRPSANMIFKLLTAASLSLAQIEHKKQEHQHKLHESHQSCSKLKRRKGSGQGQGQTMTLHDIEATNRKVQEALEQLQPIRLSSCKRTR